MNVGDKHGGGATNIRSNTRRRTWCDAEFKSTKYPTHRRNYSLMDEW